MTDFLYVIEATIKVFDLAIVHYILVVVAVRLVLSL